MKDLLTVKEVAEIMGKSEETVKRWLRAGKFANAYKETDKQGWRIPNQDVQALEASRLIPCHKDEQMTASYTSQPQEDNSKELVSLAYQAITMTSPTETMINHLITLELNEPWKYCLSCNNHRTKSKVPKDSLKRQSARGGLLLLYQSRKNEI